MKLFEGQTIIDSETGLPMTAERMSEIRNMLLAEGVKINVSPEDAEQLRADGVNIEQVQAEIWDQLGGKLS